jgi:hypothetical protein
MKKTVQHLIAAAFLAGALCAGAAETKSLSILWFGSSSTPPHLIRFFNEMLEATGEYEVEWSDKAKGYFNTAYFVKHGEGLDLKVGAGKSVEQFIKVLKKYAAQRDFDYVVVQVRHHTAMYPEIAEKAPAYIKTFCDAIRDTGAQPVFYVAPGFKNKSEQQKLTDLVTRLAEENDAPVAWGSETLLEVEAEKGHDYVANTKAGDAGHVGPFGNYTYACALYCALTGKSPVGHPLRKITTTGWNIEFGKDIPDDAHFYETDIPDEDARFIQETAWQVYQELSAEK